MIQTVRIPIIKRCSGYFLRWYYNGWHYWQFYPGTLNYKTEGEQYRTYGTRSVTMSSGPLTEAQSEAVRTVLNTREVYLFTDNGWAAVRIETGQAEIRNNLTTGCEVNFKAIIGSRMLSVTGFSPVVDVPIILPDDFCEVTIGTQIWMCKNWDANYPASKVANNVEANRLLYGGLYNFNQIMSVGFVPDGWHVPTLAEFSTLIAYCGGWVLSGGVLKAIGTTYWNSPNTGAVDTYSFDARGGGNYDPLYNFFNSFKAYGFYWTRDEVDSLNATMVYAYYNDAEMRSGSCLKRIFNSVRLVKDVAAPLIFDDWFLPSRDALREMRTELHLYGVGGFTVDHFYWSSSEVNQYQGYCLKMSAIAYEVPPNVDPITKQNGLDARACRYFTSVSPSYNLRDIGPAGGLIFWKSGNNYLEAAPTDLAGGGTAIMIWSDINLVSGNGVLISDGQANTTAIINQVGHTTSAAKLCNDLIV